MTKNQFLFSIVVALITLSYVAWHFYTTPISRVIILEDATMEESELGQIPKAIFKKITYKDGKTLCTTVNPSTLCEVGVDCTTGKELEYITLKEFLGISTNPKISVPGQKCATFDIDINSTDNPCRYVGRKLYCTSDRRLKRNSHKIGRLENGLNVYTFNYIWASALTVGVMADEVRKVKPEAVININGFDLVDYSVILK